MADWGGGRGGEASAREGGEAAQDGRGRVPLIGREAFECEQHCLLETGALDTNEGRELRLQGGRLEQRRRWQLRLALGGHGRRLALAHAQALRVHLKRDKRVDDHALLGERGCLRRRARKVLEQIVRVGGLLDGRRRVEGRLYRGWRGRRRRRRRHVWHASFLRCSLCGGLGGGGLGGGLGGGGGGGGDGGLLGIDGGHLVIRNLGRESLRDRLRVRGAARKRGNVDNNNAGTRAAANLLEQRSKIVALGCEDREEMGAPGRWRRLGHVLVGHDGFVLRLFLRNGTLDPDEGVTVNATQLYRALWSCKKSQTCRPKGRVIDRVIALPPKVASDQRRLSCVKTEQPGNRAHTAAQRTQRGARTASYLQCKSAASCQMPAEARCALC